MRIELDTDQDDDFEGREDRELLVDIIHQLRHLRREMGQLADAIVAVQADAAAILATLSPIGLEIAEIQVELAASGDIPAALTALAQLHTDLSGAATSLGADSAAMGALAGPAVTSISPAAGPVAGGTAVTVNGKGFTGATAVNFGTVAAASVAVVSDNQITVTSPAVSA